MKKLSTSAKTTEVDFVSDNAVTFYNQDPALAEDTFLKQLIDKISFESDNITEAIKRDHVLSEMEDVDAVVGKNLRALKTIVKGYAAMPDETLSTSGKALLQVINKFKLALLQKSYGEQSSNIEALLMDLSAEALKVHIANLPQVGNVIENLRTSQALFMEKNTAYAKAYAENSQLLTATELKKTLLSLINGKLIVYLTSAVMMDPDKYGPYVASLEKVIDDTNQNISQRMGSANKENNKEVSQ